MRSKRRVRRGRRADRGLLGSYVHACQLRHRAGLAAAVAGGDTGRRHAAAPGQGVGASLSAKREEAAQAIAAAERLGEPGAGPLPDGFSSAEASLTMLRACFPWGDIGAQLENGRRAAELEGPGSPWRPVACWAVGMGLYFRGEPRRSRPVVRRIGGAGAREPQWLAGASSLAYRSLIAGEQGRPGEQQLLAGQATELIREHGTEKVIGVVPLALGVSLAARGRPEDAQPLIERGIGFMLRCRGEPTRVANALLTRRRYCVPWASASARKPRSPRRDPSSGPAPIRGS